MLERGRELLVKLRDLADAFPYMSGDDAPGTITTFDRADPLAVLFRETAAMADASLRLIALFPDTATAQLQLCEGVEAVLGVVARRTELVYARLELHRAETGSVSLLAELLNDLEAGRPVGLESFIALADELLTEASQCVPLRFLDADQSRPELSVARHSLTVARVAARISPPRCRSAGSAAGCGSCCSLA